MNANTTLQTKTSSTNKFIQAASAAVLAIALSAGYAGAQTQSVPINITGTIYDDANGLENGIIDGNSISHIEGTQQLYVYLINNANTIVGKAAVALDGSYWVMGITNRNYNITISTANVNVNDVNPLLGLPATYVPTAEGEQINGDGSPDFGVQFTTPDDTVIAPINFAIDRRPEGAAYVVNPATLDPQRLMMYVPAEAFTGSDFEDGQYPQGLTGRKVDIYEPVNGELWYGNTKLAFSSSSIPVRIDNFDASQLRLDMDNGASNVRFTYAAVDNAGVSELAPNTISFPVPLLVKLTKFDVVKTGTASSRITWEVATELNHNYYAVERSIDGSNFAPIGRIYSQSKGNSTQAMNYSFADNSLPVTSAIYYRLRMVDAYGTEDFSSIQRIGGATSAQTVSVFPNPAADVINFNLTSVAEPSRINILDGTGKVVLSSEATGGSVTSLSLNSLPAGRYFYHISLGQSTITGNSFTIVK